MYDDHLNTPPWLLPADALLDAVERHLDTAHASAAAIIAVRLADHLPNFRLSRHRVHTTMTGLAVDGIPCHELATRSLPVLRALRQAARLVDQLPEGVLRHLAEHGALNHDCVGSGAKTTRSWA